MSPGPDVADSAGVRGKMTQIGHYRIAAIRSCPFPRHTVFVIANSWLTVAPARCPKHLISGISHLAYRILRAHSDRSPMRSCFSASMIAKNATPTPITRTPSNTGTAAVPKTSCSGGK